MRVRIMMHYALTFFIACLFIVVINILYMQSSVYKDEGLYHFDPQLYTQEIKAGVTPISSSQLEMSSELTELLKNENIAVQIIDDSLNEVFRSDRLTGNVQKTYAPKDLMDLYENVNLTVFVDSLKINDINYTVFLFFDSQDVKRTIYTFETDRVNQAYNPFWLIGMNLVLILMVSYMYTYSITRPVHRINERIIDLSNGNYELLNTRKGIYFNIEEAINALADQLRRAEKEQARAEVTREEWISNLSHDIKTPLTSIMGYAEIMGEEAYELLSDERSQYSQIILDKGNYIETLLSDLNMSTRLKHGQLPVRLERIDLVAEIKETLIDLMNHFEPIYSKNKIAFTTAENEIFMEIDRQLFKRGLTNIVMNAFVHNKQPVSVKVRVDTTKNQWIELSIEDDGKGVQNYEYDQIFTRYYRGTHTRTYSEGTGLGMAIAKDIVEAHKGSIRAEKSTQGGLRIVIRLKR